MIITCPQCQARYNVAADAIPDQGRKVKCAACTHQWVQLADGGIKVGADTSSDASSTTGDNLKTNAAGAKDAGKTIGKPGRGKRPPLPAHEAMRKRSHNRVRTGHRLAAGVAWAASIAICVGCLSLAVDRRTEIVRAWPQAASGFALIGLPANLYGVDIGALEISAGLDEQGPRLSISGELRSVSKIIEPVPYLRAALLNEAGVEVASWLVDPGILELEPGAVHRFSTQRRNPPRGMLHAEVVFAEPPPEAPRPPPEPPTGDSGLMGAKAGPAEAAVADGELGPATPAPVPEPLPETAAEPAPAKVAAPTSAAAR